VTTKLPKSSPKHAARLPR